jgi:hypothetical protein
MRRWVAVVACLVVVLGLAPVAFAQAPAPKVTINGLFDQVTSGGKNIYDGDFSRSSEREWYARTRFRPDFTFEVGRTKAVLGFEIDLTYGSTTGGDGSFAGGCGKAGSNGCLDLNTDVASQIEVKWIYTEFDLTGKDSLLPFIPVGTVARVGGQPFSTLANYKVAYANGDFGGASTVTTWAPNLKTNFAWVMVEEEIAGSNRLVRNVAGNRRGEDWAVIFSADITPFKGLDIKPLISHFHADGATSGAARRAVNNLQGAVAPTQEDRTTLGLDARFRSGPFSFDPTFMFQFGQTTQRLTSTQHAGITAFLVDLQGGFQLGPLLLEARGVFTTGNEADDDLRSGRIRYFQPLDLDTGYWAGWSAIQALGIDYFNGGGGTIGGMATLIGYDRYGRMGGALRATYSLTPELAFYGVVSPTWTHRKVDTDTAIAAGGIRAACAAATCDGDSRYIGTEVDLGTTWRFAPNTVFDLQGAYLFAGGALDTLDASGSRDARDGWTIAARIRMSF